MNFSFSNIDIFNPLINEDYFYEIAKVNILGFRVFNFLPGIIMKITPALKKRRNL